jgi:hypothetical protein
MLSLVAHPDTPAPGLVVQAHLERTGTGLLATYAVTVERGASAPLWPPEHSPAERRDGLWRTTCLELFVRPAGEGCYLEFNVAPSGDWAAYSFTGYRAGMAALELAQPPLVTVAMAQAGGQMVHQLSVEIGLGPAELAGAMAGLTAVIEQEDGAVSYWSLRHAPGEPDFHHPDCLALQLPPIGPP